MKQANKLLFSLITHLRESLIMLLAIFSSLILLPAGTALANSQLLIDAVEFEQSNQLNVPFRSNTVPFNYTNGSVTFTTCQDQACTWAIDDAAQLVVTRPDGSQATRDFISDTKDKPAEIISNMFQAGTNSVTINLIDHFTPLRGLPRPLYLVSSSSATLPQPKPEVKQLSVSKKYIKHPYILYSKDPVNTYTGSYSYSKTDVSVAGRGPVPVFSRVYDSGDTLTGPFGPGWTHSYAIQLVRPDETTNDIVLIGKEGRADRFVYNNGNYSAPEGVYTSLVKNNNNTYTVMHKDLTTWSFDETGKLLRITDRFGNQSTLGYDGDGKLVSVSDPAGRGSLAINYDGAGRIISVADWIGRSVNYTYDTNGRLSTTTDREGKITIYTYDGASQRITTIKDARDNVVVTNTYDAQGRVATQKDARGLTTGQQTTFTYNTNADNTKTTIVTYPKTSSEPGWSFVEEDTYDSKGRVIKKVSKPVSNSAEWITHEYGYDANGNRTSFKDGLGNTTKYCYDVDYAGAAISASRGNQTRLIAPPPAYGSNLPVTLYKYDDKNNLIQTVSPKGVASGTSADCATNLTANLNSTYATDFAYDTETKTKLISTTNRYNEPGVGQKTVITKYEYSDPANPGLPTKMIAPRGNTGVTPDYSFATTNTYFNSGSKAGMLESVTIPSGAVTKYDYDAIGQQISMTDPKGNISGGIPAEHTWQYVYDNEDRILFTKAPAPVAGQAQLVTENRYDTVGNKTVVIDVNGQVTRYVYDERDSLKEAHQSPSTWTDPSVSPTDLIKSEYQYDNLGNLTRTIRAKGNSADEHTIDYVFDGLNRVTREIQYPSWPATTPTLVTIYTYDKNSNRTSLKDPLVKTTIYSYDALNRLTKITYNNSTTPNATYSYDSNGNRTKMVDGTGTTNYTYDELDRMLSVQSPGPKTIGYRYDLDGNRTKLIYPDNTAVAYTFDKTNRLESLVDWSNRKTSYEYFVDSMPKRVNNQMNGTSANYTYDNAGRLTQVWNKEGENTITQHTYQMDAAGNRTHTDEVLTNGYYAGPITSDRQGTIDYNYDKLYRLTKENRQLPIPQNDEILDYAYDPVGNRLSETITNLVAKRTDFTYDKADRIKTASGNIDEVYTVDANGNMTKRGSSGGDTFTYDQANRMYNALSYRYIYDGDGKRTKVLKVGLFTTTVNTYLYDVNQDLPVLLQDKDNKYVWGLDLLYTVNASNEPGVYHYDGLGSMRAITDVRTPDRPRIQMYEEYKAFGVEGYSNRTYNQPFKFTGEQKDEWPQAEYIYMRARYYDPAIGRFMTRDTVAGDTKEPLSLNRYTYVQNNPVNFTDPSGMIDAWQVSLGGARAVGGTAEVGIGIAVIAGTTLETAGVGAVVGTALFTHGTYEMSAGTADVITGWNDEKPETPNPVRAITSGFTTNENYLNTADITDFVLFSKMSKIGQLPKAYSWLNNAGAISDMGNLMDIYLGPLHDPRPVYAPKRNK